MNNLPELPPEITTVEQADAMGKALSRVVHFHAAWCRRVFSGDPAMHWNTGPCVLNKEIKSLWRDNWTDNEKRRILAAYVSNLLMT